MIIEIGIIIIVDYVKLSYLHRWKYEVGCGKATPFYGVALRALLLKFYKSPLSVLVHFCRFLAVVTWLWNVESSLGR